MKKYKNVLEHPRKQNHIDVFGKDPENMDEFFEMCIAVINDRFARSADNSHVKVTGMAMNIRHSDNVSNSHSSPLLGVSNFSREKDKPTGYPGWSGRLWLRYSDRLRGFGSDAVGATLTYTGTGGGGAYDGPWKDISHQYYSAPARLKLAHPGPVLFSWDYRFFDMDFPGLDNEALRYYNIEMKKYEEKYENYLKHKTAFLISNKNRPVPPTKPNNPSFYKAWTDPETVKQDKEFIESIEKIRSRRILGRKAKEYV